MIEKRAMSSVAVGCNETKNTGNETCVNESVLCDEFGLCINVATILRFYVFGANSRAGTVALCRTTSGDIIDADCVSVVAMSYDIVRCVNRDVKSMCLITATLDDIVRCPPVSCALKST